MPGADAVTVTLVGEIDVARAGATEDALGVAIAGDPGATVTVDLAEVTFLDSTGLRALVRSKLAAEESGGQLVVVNPSAHIRRIFEVTGLAPHLGVDR